MGNKPREPREPHRNALQRTEPKRTEPKRCDALKTEPHALYFHNLFFRFSQNFPERGVGQWERVAGYRVQLPVAAQPAPVPATTFDLLCFAANISFVRMMPEKAKQTRTRTANNATRYVQVLPPLLDASPSPLYTCVVQNVLRAFFCPLKIAEASLIYRLIGVSKS